MLWIGDARMAIVGVVTEAWTRIEDWLNRYAPASAART